MTTITIEKAIVHRALSALEYHTQQTRPIHNTELVIEELRDALAAPATAPGRKPMTDAQAYAIAGAVFPYSQHAKCLELIRDVESHYKIGQESG